MFSVALSVPYGPTNYEAHCPVELGLSSLGCAQSDHPSACRPTEYCLLADALHQTAQIVRKWRPEVQDCSRARMRELQLRGMEEIASGLPIFAGKRGVPPLPIHVIPNDSVADGGEVDAYLMCPAGMDSHFQQGEIAEFFKPAIRTESHAPAAL